MDEYLTMAKGFWKDLNEFTIYKGDSEDHGITSGYNYGFSLPFERVNDPKAITLFLQRNWHHTFTISIGYFLAIKVLQSYMSNRPAFSLKLPLFLWNGALALFSITGCLRFGEDLLISLFTRPIYETVCFSCEAHDVAAFWSLLFAISKIVELGDTLFIVLRKKPLIFLHYYHHAAVLIYTIHSGAEHTGAGRAFITMNYFAHSCMYSYYAISALGVRLPKFVSMAVTTIQTMQMLAGVAISCIVYRIKTTTDWTCQQSMPNLYLAFVIYITFGVLFIQFFLNAYIFRKKSVDGKKKKQ